MLLPLGHALVAIAGMTSDDGRCKFLDSRANGYVRSEGIGAVLLEPESDEVGEATRGEQLMEHEPRLCGSAVRSDGKSASLTAPNGEAQVGLLLAAQVRQAGFKHIPSTHANPDPSAPRPGYLRRQRCR